MPAALRSGAPVRFGLRDLPLLGDLLELLGGLAQRVLLADETRLAIRRKPRRILVRANVGEFPLVNSERLIDLRRRKVLRFDMPAYCWAA